VTEIGPTSLTLTKASVVGSLPGGFEYLITPGVVYGTGAMAHRLTPCARHGLMGKFYLHPLSDWLSRLLLLMGRLPEGVGSGYLLALGTSDLVN